jgi:outer membrane protein assembly factor BamB
VQREQNLRGRSVRNTCVTSRRTLSRALVVGLAVCLPVLSPGAASAGTGQPVSSWPQFGRTALHLDVNPFEHAFTPENVRSLATVWKGHYGQNTTTEGGPVAAGGFVYSTGFDGFLSAFDLDGCGSPSCEPLWKGHTNNDITGTPAVAGGLVLVGSADHFLYAFAAAGCGSTRCPPLWKGRLADAVVDSSVAVADGIAYIGDYGGHLSAFAVQGCGHSVCDPLWVGQGRAGELFTAPAVGKGSVFVGTMNATPQAFTGRLVVFPVGGCGEPVCRPTWVADIGGPATLTASPTVSDDTVFIGSSSLLAFAAAGCGARTCQPLRSYDLGDSGMETTPAVVGDVLLATTQDTPDPNTVGVVAAFPAHGCGAARCEPLWTGINFAAGFASSPAVAGGLVFVGKGPASGFPVDAGLYVFDVNGCGAPTCKALSFTQLGESQFYLGAPLAIADGKVIMASNDNTDGHSNLYVMSVSR